MNKSDSPVGELTPAQAQQLTAEILAHLDGANKQIYEARRKLHEIDVKRGWAALNYKSFTDWATQTLTTKTSQASRQRIAAQIETIIFDDGSIGLVPERSIRALGKYRDKPGVVQALYAIAQEVAGPNNPVTGAHTEAVVDSLADALTSGTLQTDGGEQISLTAHNPDGTPKPATLLFTNDVLGRLAEQVKRNRQNVKAGFALQGETPQHTVLKSELVVIELGAKRAVVLQNQEKTITLTVYWPKLQTPPALGSKMNLKMLAPDEPGIDLKPVGIPTPYRPQIVPKHG